MSWVDCLHALRFADNRKHRAELEALIARVMPPGYRNRSGDDIDKAINKKAEVFWAKRQANRVE